MLLWRLVRTSRLALYGLIAIAAGIAVSGYGLLHQLPKEAELQTVEGRVEKATKVTTRRRRGGESVSYKLEIKDQKGNDLTLTLPSAEITQAQVITVLNARRMVAKFDAENDVYVLSADGRQMIDYITTLKRRQSSDAFLVTGGMYAGLAGLLVMFVGWFWNRRHLA